MFYASFYCFYKFCVFVCSKKLTEHERKRNEEAFLNGDKFKKYEVAIKVIL